MMDTTVVLELAKQDIFKLLPLVMVDLGWETKTHNKIIKELVTVKDMFSKRCAYLCLFKISYQFEFIYCLKIFVYYV